MKAISVPVSPGELLDKITILEIKSRRISDSDKLKNVRHELDLLRSIWSESIPSDVELNALRDALAGINEKLWDIEDAIRDCEAKSDFGDRFIRLARSVYMTNDERARLKREVNLVLGSSLVEEKSYREYRDTPDP